LLTTFAVISYSTRGNIISCRLRNLQLIIFPRVEYEITAKVVSKKHYHYSWESKIVPYDFALAWGKLTEPGMKKFIKYSQMRRFYFYKYAQNCPLKQDYI